MLITFSSIGNTNRLHAQKDTQAVVGPQLSITEPTRSSRLHSRGIDCQVCPSLRLCTQSMRHVRRTVTIRPKEQYDALQARRQQETTKDFKALYATRAGARCDHFARSAHDGITSITLHRPRANASPTCSNRCSTEYRSSHPLAQWRTSYQDETVTFCSTASSGCLTGITRARHQYHMW
jgi:hypothetical protein